MRKLTNDGSTCLVLSEHQYISLCSIIDELTKRSKAMLTLVSDVSGLVIYKTGELGQVDTTCLSALAAADFAATSEMAKLLGEDGGFGLHFHEGSSKNIFILGVSNSLLLTVVFSTETTFGMVRVCAEKASKKLSAILKSRKENSGHTVEIVHKKEAFDEQAFSNELSARLGKALK